MEIYLLFHLKETTDAEINEAFILSTSKFLKTRESEYFMWQLSDVHFCKYLLIWKMNREVL